MSVDLKNFLEASGLGILYDTFVADDIDLTLAKMLTESDLIELGLSIGQRKRFVLAIASLAQTDAAPEEVVPERRQITVLFADLVGSTHLSEIMDAEDLREYLMLYRQACVDVCRANNGHIAFQQGDGITVFSAIRRPASMMPKMRFGLAWRSCRRSAPLMRMPP